MFSLSNDCWHKETSFKGIYKNLTIVGKNLFRTNSFFFSNILSNVRNNTFRKFHGKVLTHFQNILSIIYYYSPLTQPEFGSVDGVGDRVGVVAIYLNHWLIEYFFNEWNHNAFFRTLESAAISNMIYLNGVCCIMVEMHHGWNGIKLMLHMCHKYLFISKRKIIYSF